MDEFEKFRTMMDDINRERDLISLFRGTTETMRNAVVEILKATQIDQAKEDDLK